MRANETVSGKRKCSDLTELPSFFNTWLFPLERAVLKEIQTFWRTARTAIKFEVQRHEF